ncbi:PiggyBac transposable element-derived protein 4-like [Plakobranchus ocellatus]|uniref:PiggyBac transposable element-derived protein 4-like n=1 Tax=Plakobranchus ocellatus TaxID=259542 RepID=A0AAV4CPE3_9GAST|nr:PiggyBac transposable element-derived protein 4-like [Plakobranchus ocellatus]
MSRLRKITLSEARNLLSDALFAAFDSDSSADESDSENRFHFDDEFVGEDDTSSSDPDFTTHQAVVSSDDDINQPSTSTSRPRGRPKKSGALTRPVAVENPNWREVKNEQTQNNYRFVPPVGPGVIADLTHESSALDCLTTLMTTNILTTLLNNINSYAEKRVQMNRPAKKRSLLSLWTPITLGELYRYFAILIAMGLNKRPKVRNFWSTQVVQ